MTRFNPRRISQENAGPPQVFLRPLGGQGRTRSAFGGSLPVAAALLCVVVALLSYLALVAYESDHHTTFWH